VRTVLDEQGGASHGWFLEGFVLRERAVTLVLAEGIAADEPTPLVIGEHTLEGSRLVEVTTQSRRFRVVFQDVAAHQVIDESYTAWDEYEQLDGTDQIRVLSRSRFLDFIHAHHGWMFVMVDGLRHYQVVTLDSVVDIVAAGEPIITREIK
jgi:hypothetical protein